MKHLLITQSILILINSILETPFNWWIVCSPILAYVLYDVVKYAIVETKYERIWRDRHTKEGRERYEKAMKPKIRNLIEEANKNLN